MVQTDVRSCIHKYTVSAAICGHLLTQMLLCHVYIRTHIQYIRTCLYIYTHYIQLYNYIVIKLCMYDCMYVRAYNSIQNIYNRNVRNITILSRDWNKSCFQFNSCWFWTRCEHTFAIQLSKQ